MNTKNLPVITVTNEEYNKLLKIIAEYSIKQNKKVSIKNAVISLILEKKLENDKK